MDFRTMRRKMMAVFIGGCIALMLGTAAQAEPASPGGMMQSLQQSAPPVDLQPMTLTDAEPAMQSAEKPPQADSDASALRVFIREVDLTGADRLPKKAVEALIAPYLMQENSLSDLQDLADGLSALYWETGTLGRVIIPEQDIDDGRGILHLQAIEGKVGQIELMDGLYYQARSIRYGIGLKQGEPFNLRRLRRNLLLLSDNPDRRAEAVVRAGAAPGTSDVQIGIHDFNPVHIAPSWDNLGRTGLGTQRFGVGITHNNLLGFGDMLSTTPLVSRDFYGIVSRYQIPVGSHGTRLGVEHLAVHTRLPGQIGNGYFLSPFISQNWVEKEFIKVNSDLALDFMQSQSHTPGTVPLDRDQLRVLRGGITMDAQDNWGKTWMRHEMGLGLDVLGGTDGSQALASRPGAGTRFLRYTGMLTRLQTLPHSSQGIFRLVGQASPDILPTLETLQAGGAYTVRGYREGYFLGDKGLLASAELRMPLFLVPKSWHIGHGPHPTSIRDNMQLVGFVDYGWVGFNRPNNPVLATTAAGSVQLLGIGGGLRVRLTRFLVGRVDLAFPLIDQVQNHSARLHFGLQSNLL